MPLRVVNVAEEAARLTEPFSLIELAYVDYFGRRLYLLWGGYLA
jgi:hypothetical protein